MTSDERKRIIETLITALLTCAAIAFGVTGCKVWRTITTTSTYVQKQDSAQTSATITTKTVEEYQGHKKH